VRWHVMVVAPPPPTARARQTQRRRNPQNNATCEKQLRLSICKPRCMRVLNRIRKCLRLLGMANTSERMMFVRTYMLLRRKYPDTVGGIARDEDAMKYLMHEILCDWMTQRHRLRLLINRWGEAIDDQDAILAHLADEHIAWCMRAIPHTTSEATLSQDLLQ
jgi:hypothetical protein